MSLKEINSTSVIAAVAAALTLGAATSASAAPQTSVSVPSKSSISALNKDGISSLKGATSTSASTAIAAASTPVTAAAPQTGVDLPPNVNIFALTSDNSVYVLFPGDISFIRLGRLDSPSSGNIIGMDFRPADQNLYALTDKGQLCTIDAFGGGLLFITPISTLNPRFPGGFSMLADFNPVVNALRVVGADDKNFAVVNGTDGSNLSTTAVQTNFTYATGDVNFGVDPEIVGGAYTNNFVGATSTLFYAVDHDLDTLVTIADKTATGSSNTGNGKLQTIGALVDLNGNRLNLSPSTDLDIYTNANGTNFLVGISMGQLFSINLSQINPNLPLGTTQNVVVKIGPLPPLPGSFAPITGGVIDIAFQPPLP